MRTPNKTELLYLFTSKLCSLQGCLQVMSLTKQRLESHTFLLILAPTVKAVVKAALRYLLKHQTAECMTPFQGGNSYSDLRLQAYKHLIFDLKLDSFLEKPGVGQQEAPCGKALWLKYIFWGNPSYFIQSSIRLFDFLGNFPHCPYEKFVSVL